MAPEPGADGVVRLLDAGGTPVDRTAAQVSKDVVLDGLRIMVAARALDERAVAMHRRGRLGTYPPSLGQEGTYAGAALAVDRERDWMVPQYREIPALLHHGVPLERILLYYMGDPAGGWYPARVRALPFQISVAAHLPHAVGLAWGLAHQGLDGVVLAFLGDGGTSEGDFAEACNLAGVLRAPVVFVVSNNGWAISTPYRQQTAAVRLADRAVGFGFDGVVVDGNDMLAVYAVVRAAVERCRQGGGPTLVEALTYRCGPHSTVDDPSRYRDDDEVAAWSRLDPLRRLESHAVGRGIWSAAATEDEFAVARRRVDEAFALAQSMHQPSPAQLFDHVYAAPSARMAAQLAALGRSTTGQPPGRQPGRQR